MGRRLLERDAELARLGELIEAAADGRGAAVVLVGPAGIGKTSLLAELRRAASERGFGCVAARGGELERDFPYGVMRQLLERPLRRMDAQERAAVLDAAAAPAAGALGLAEAGAADAFTVTHALYWTCVNLAAGRPLLIAVDDLHWADAASLRFLAYLARRVDDLPILVVAATRPAVEASDPALVETVTSAREVATVPLAPLSRAAVGELVHSTLGAAEEDVVGTCFQATGGNPFLCEAMLETLAEDGAAAATSDLSAHVLARLGRLSPSATALARAVAVLGTNADLRHAAALAELSERDGATAADALAAQGILQVGRPLEFVHPLVRSAVTDGIPPAELLLGHARAARVLDAAGAPVDAVAAHLLGTDPARDAWALARLRTAAAAASARGAPEAAVVYLARALDEAADAATRAGVLRELGVAAFGAGRPDDAVEHLEEAFRHAPTREDQLAAVPPLLAACTMRGAYADGARFVAEALEGGPTDDDTRRTLEAHLLQTVTLEPALRPRYAQHLARIERELEQGLHLDHPGYAIGRMTLAISGERPASEVVALARQIDAAPMVRELAGGGVTWGNMLVPLISADGFDIAERILAAGVAEAQRLSSAVVIARAFGTRALLHLRRGDLREAIADARIALAASADRFYMAALVLSHYVNALREHGDLETANEALDELGFAAKIPDTFLHNWALTARAELRLAEGRVDEAVADFELVRERFDARGQRNPGPFAYRGGLALALRRAGDHERALALATEELELARRWGAPRTLAVALRVLGLVAGGDRGLALLQESVDVLDGSQARLERARSLVELGAAIRRAGRRREAREPLHAGMELAHSCDAQPLVRQAREELLALGARPRRIMRTGVDALTPSELRVSRLAADGLTNREIAQALYVTLRTVQVHLTHSYQKLGISSREQLPESLRSPARCEGLPAGAASPS